MTMSLHKESPNLDLLRSVAVLAVLADHVAATHGIAQKHVFLFALGYWGVLVFFVHTSFVLMMSLERLRLDGWRLYTTFYLRRFFRIYPLSIATVALAIGLHIPHRSWNSDYYHLGLKTIISNVLLCQNLTLSHSVIGPMWSLPYEVQMYSLLPALFALVRRSRSSKALIGIWLASITIGFLQPWVGGTDLGLHLRIDRLGIAQYIPCFLTGVTAYYIALRWREPKLQFWLWPLFLAFMTAAYLRWQASTGEKAYVEWCCCLGVGLMVTRCLESPYAWLNRFTHSIAKYSYGLYLGQVPVLWLAFVKLHYLSKSAQWCIFLFLIVLVPVASYHLIEAPLIRVGAGLSASALKPSRLAALADPVRT
jgi:peptidoglycan/LPS O-acetylase OafA/YrhL